MQSSSDLFMIVLGVAVLVLLGLLLRRSGQGPGAAAGPSAAALAEQDKALIQRRVAEGRTKPLGRMAPLDAATVDRATRIVGMCGPEPYMRALDQGAQVVLGGRSSDPAPFAANAMRAQLPPGPAWYAGKMLECGAAPALPKGPDCLHVIVREDGIICEPMGNRACTPMSVANHSLHENASPIRHVEPGGTLDTSDCRFEAVSDFLSKEFLGLDSALHQYYKGHTQFWRYMCMCLMTIVELF